MLKELVPQFLSALIVICSIIVVSQLVRLSDVLVTFGLTPENILLPFLYLILPFISLTIPIAFLFAVLLTFGRLSADGEYAALLASGFSLRRAAVPVLIMAGVLYVIGAACDLNLEAWGRRELVQFFHRKTQTELDNMVKYKMQPGVFLNDFIGYVLYAEKISEDRQRFDNVLLAPRGNSKENFTVLAPSGKITGSVEEGSLRLSLDYGVAFTTFPGTNKTSILKFKRAEIDLLRIFKEQILGSDAAEDDFRSFPPKALFAYVDKLEADPKRDEGQYRKARYLLHKRIGMPFSVITFAFFGMVLGVSDPRRGKSWAYIGAIATIIVGFVIFVGFQSLAESGRLSAPLAVWLPNILLLLFGGFLVYQKNRLPPAEGTLDWRNLPLFGKHPK